MARDGQEWPGMRHRTIVRRRGKREKDGVEGQHNEHYCYHPKQQPAAQLGRGVKIVGSQPGENPDQPRPERIATQWRGTSSKVRCAVSVVPYGTLGGSESTEMSETDASDLSSERSAMTCGGRVTPHLVIGQAAINSLISACHRTQCSRRCSDNGGSGCPIPGRRRKYWRCSSKARQKREAESKFPKPRMG